MWARGEQGQWGHEIGDSGLVLSDALYTVISTLGGTEHARWTAWGERVEWDLRTLGCRLRTESFPDFQGCLGAALSQCKVVSECEQKGLRESSDPFPDPFPPGPADTEQLVVS